MRTSTFVMAAVVALAAPPEKQTYSCSGEVEFVSTRLSR